MGGARTLRRSAWMLLLPDKAPRPARARAGARPAAVLLGLLLLPASALAGFELHRIDAPAEPVPPGEAATIDVDVDIDCSSVWLQDPFVIRIERNASIPVTGPDELRVPRSACAAPQGITEQVATYEARIPGGQPAYEEIAVSFTLTSNDHPLDPSQTHTGTATLQADGRPSLTAATSTRTVATAGPANATIDLLNNGNVDVAVSWNVLGIEGLVFSGPERLARDASAQGVLRFEPPSGWERFTSNLTFIGKDVTGRESAPVTVGVEWVPQQASGKESPWPAPWLLGLLALRRRR